MKCPSAAVVRLFVAAGFSFFFVASASADDESGVPFSLGSIELRATFDAGADAISMTNAQFGQGSTSATGRSEGGRTWYEGYARPGLDFQWETIYGRASAIAAGTRGEGEATQQSTTSDRPDHLALEEAFVGWRSGSVFALSDAVDLSVGNQEFMVGDGFLIANGTADGAGRAATYLGPRGAFESTAILRLNTDPVRADVFHLSGTVDQDVMRAGDNPATRLYGINVEWFDSFDGGEGRFDYESRRWYVGLTALKVYDADRDFSFAGSQGGAATAANRDGLETLAARFGGSFVPGLDGLSLFGEWGLQRNDAGANGGTVRAQAWHLQPQYIWADAPGSPMLTARYAHFSGDANTGDAVDRSWDPLFSDAGPRGDNTWVQGLIYGNYLGANSNLNSVYIGAEVQPVEDVLRLGVALYRHYYDEPAEAGAGARHLMDEIDLYAEWVTPVPGLTVAPALAAGRAGRGQRQALGIAEGDARTIWLAQIVLGYAF